MATRRLTAGQIKVTEPLPWDVYDASGKLLLCRGSVIAKESQLDNLLERGMFIADVDSPAQNRSTTPSTAIPVLEEAFNPFVWWDTLVTKLRRILRDPGNETGLPEKIVAIAETIIKFVEKDGDAAIAVGMLDDHGKYAISHSVQAAMLCELIATKLDWPVERRRSTICAALTMNVSMLDLQMTLTNQNTPPTPEQRAAIESHPELSAKLLEAAGVNDAIWLQVIREHHETPGGGGYPNGLKELTDEALLVRTVDIFGAKVAGRINRRAMSPNQAAKSLFIGESRNLGNTIANLLIKIIGIYPPGSFVKLASGETAVVCRRGDAATAPLVYSLTSGSGTPYLAPLRRDTQSKEYEIVSVLPRDKLMVIHNISKLWLSNAPRQIQVMNADTYLNKQ